MTFGFVVAVIDLAWAFSSFVVWRKRGDREALWYGWFGIVACAALSISVIVMQMAQVSPMAQVPPLALYLDSSINIVVAAVGLFLLIRTGHRTWRRWRREPHRIV